MSSSNYLQFIDCTVSGGDFDTAREAPNISKSIFPAETALVAFDSQINTYTYVFMPFLHEIFFEIFGVSHAVSKSPPMSTHPHLWYPWCSKYKNYRIAHQGRKGNLFSSNLYTNQLKNELLSVTYNTITNIIFTVSESNKMVAKH